MFYWIVIDKLLVTTNKNFSHHVTTVALVFDLLLGFKIIWFSKIRKVLKWKKHLIEVLFAEKEGFEPPDLLQSTVFKTAAFDRSAISPVCRFHYLIASANIRTFFGYANVFLEKMQLFFKELFNCFICFALHRKVFCVT